MIISSWFTPNNLADLFFVIRRILQLLPHLFLQIIPVIIQLLASA